MAVSAPRAAPLVAVLARGMIPQAYHGTPITPNAAFVAVMPGRGACVSYARPDQVAMAEEVCGELVMYDNGAFSAWTKGKATDWPGYYAWLEPRLTGERWAVIPDIIDAPSQMQDGLLNDWPHGDFGAPVWHTDEPVNRLLRLCERWPRVCFGSTGAHWKVGGDDWRARMDEVWPQFGNSHPKIHMLRGLAVMRDYPFRQRRQQQPSAERMEA